MMLTIAEAMDDPGLFQPSFASASWFSWRAIIKAAFALPLTKQERDCFRTVADREPPTRQVRELWVIGGRRAGKDSIASLIAAYAASFFEHEDRLRPGERALVMCLALDREQAKIVLNYIRSYFQDILPLRSMVLRETLDGLELDNRVDITVATNSFRSVRGRSVLCAIFDETAYWRDDRSANPDSETYSAVMPGLATLPGSMLIGISSPYRRAGLLYEKWREHYGKDDDDVLVIRAPSTVLNPTLDRRIIDEALARDPVAARADWLAEWRDDISTFLSRELIEAAIDHGVMVRPPVHGVFYHGFADPSGGVGDSFTAAVAHNEDSAVILDCLMEVPAPFNPSLATEQIAEMLKSYGLSKVVGDRYSAQWVVDAFGKVGIRYEHSERDRSTIYLEALPLFTTGRARLLDHRKLVAQFASLERRTSPVGRDRVDHGPNFHDDLCNSAAGAMALASGESGLSTWRRIGELVGDIPPGNAWESPLGIPLRG
jgi:hypothetical protein